MSMNIGVTEFEIETVDSPTSGREDGVFQRFLTTIGSLKPGQSFVMEMVRPHHRIAFACAKSWMNWQIITRTEGEKTRITRIS